MDDVKWAIAREIPHLRRYARALLRDADAADDLVQDCLERALRKRHLWGRRGRLRSWLFSVLYRVHLNKARSQRHAPTAVGVDRIDAVMAQPARQEKHMECRDIADALTLLPEEQRAPILLIALDGLPYDEAASVLGIPIGTLRSRLSRGRETLRALRTARARRPALRRVK